MKKSLYYLNSEKMLRLKFSFYNINLLDFLWFEKNSLYKCYNISKIDPHVSI